MQKLFSFQFSRNIWRILRDQDPNSSLWAIELRSGTEQKVSFAVVDIAQHALIWEGTPEAVDWWTSLSAFFNGSLFLHQYRYPDVPEPTDLLMVDGSNGTLEWVLPQHVLVQVVNREIIEVVTRVGEQLQHTQRHLLSGLPVQSPVERGEITDSIILKEPIRYKEGDSYFEALATFIGGFPEGHQPVVIDYLEKRPYIMFSYYIYESEKIAEYLLIVTSKREKLLFEKLSEGREGIGQSTMLLSQDNLVYLKNNNEFIGLRLN